MFSMDAIRRSCWTATLSGRSALGRKAGDLADCRKGEGWKVDLARHLRERHLTPYRWIALNLRMGAPSCVQSLVSRRRQQKDSEEWRKFRAQQLLGHARLDTTQIYTEVSINALKEAHARTHPSSQANEA